MLRSSPGIRNTPRVTLSSVQPPAIDCQVTYDESFILFRRREYEKAIAGFQNFLTHCGSHKLAGNAYYWMGECYYSLEKYDLAVAQFTYLITNFGSSVNASRAMYKLGRSYPDLGKKDDARKTFHIIIDE